MSRHQFLSLGLFLVVSLGWSLVFFTVRPLDFLPEVLPAPFGLLIAWLPPLGMFAVSLLLRRTSFSELPTSFFGESRKWSILIALVPIGLLGGFGVDNEMGIQANLFGLFMGALLIIYTILEEYGWRGYLQHALPIRSEWLKYTLIALVWYIWHWDFLDGIGWGSLLIWGL
ncbi:MAG: CPBP family glutamic-type intramembrane protease, partial [Bacteroidota bacterium]